MTGNQIFQTKFSEVHEDLLAVQSQFDSIQSRASSLEHQLTETQQLSRQQEETIKSQNRPLSTSPCPLWLSTCLPPCSFISQPIHSFLLSPYSLPPKNLFRLAFLALSSYPFHIFSLLPCYARYFVHDKTKRLVSTINVFH